jgi:hypothetical protein
MANGYLSKFLTYRLRGLARPQLMDDTSFFRDFYNFMDVPKFYKDFFGWFHHLTLADRKPSLNTKNSSSQSSLFLIFLATFPDLMNLLH